MKNKINFYLVATVISLMFASNIFAQGIYVNVGGGYGWPAAPNLFAASDNTSTNTGTSTTYNYKRVKGSGSFGKGGQVAGTFGYMCNENIGAEISFGYLFGSKITNKQTSTGGSSSWSDESTLTGKMFRIIPALKISAGKKDFKPYIRAGIVIGVGNKLTSTDDYSESGITTNTEQTEGRYSGGNSIGFAGGVGFDYMFGKKIGVFVEASLIAQSWAPKKYVVTKDVKDGVDILPTLSTRDKETEFVDNYTVTYPKTNNDVPDKAEKIYMPFSSAGINLGLHIAFGNCEKKTQTQ